VTGICGTLEWLLTIREIRQEHGNHCQRATTKSSQRLSNFSLPLYIHSIHLFPGPGKTSQTSEISSPCSTTSISEPGVHSPNELSLFSSDALTTITTAISILLARTAHEFVYIGGGYWAFLFGHGNRVCNNDPSTRQRYISVWFILF